MQHDAAAARRHLDSLHRTLGEHVDAAEFDNFYATSFRPLVRQLYAMTGAPEGTIKARLSRGRAALAVLLSDTVTEGSDRA